MSKSMPGLYRLTFTLRHDSGTAKLTRVVNDLDLNRQIDLICQSELCPRRAIRNVSIKPLW